MTREGACVREREGAHINAMHVSVNHISQTFAKIRFLMNAVRTVRSASGSVSFAMSFNRTATPPTQIFHVSVSNCRMLPPFRNAMHIALLKIRTSQTFTEFSYTKMHIYNTHRISFHSSSRGNYKDGGGVYKERPSYDLQQFQPSFGVEEYNGNSI